VTAAVDSADWCEGFGALTICGTRTVEHSRTSEGVKWCFHCRNRHEFWRVLWVPDGPSYYDPHLTIEGVKDDCTDLFPGWTREWGEGW
jgi:hypothetical protein